MTHPLSVPFLSAAAVVAAIGCASRSAPVAVAVAAAGWASTRRFERPGVRAACLLVLLALSATWRSSAAHESLHPDRLGPYVGWVRLVDDPIPALGATRVIIEIDGERFESWERGRAGRLRVDTWRGGEYVLVSGDRRAVDDRRRDRVRWQHIVGEFDMGWASDVRPGSAVDRASNRVRSAIERAAATLPGHDGSLFRGLVVGDDRDQPRAMIDRFRASGLSHLTAVSGQNVAFVLAAAGPFLRAVRPWLRWAVTLALIAWFVSLTRFEPSIVRAGTMAGLSATAFVLGRSGSPTRLLAVAVTGLLFVDPLLVWSVGFWLSVGATAGVTAVAPRLEPWFAPLGRAASPVAITVGAQIGVMVPALVVFGRLPLVSIPANLLAVPVAGFVMLYGLPAGLMSAAVPPLATAAMFPCRIGVRWVDTVAVLGAHVEPSGAAVWWGWAGLCLTGVAVGVVAARKGDHHGSSSALRRRRDDPAVEDQRPDPRTRRGR